MRDPRAAARVALGIELRRIRRKVRRLNVADLAAFDPELNPQAFTSAEGGCVEDCDLMRRIISVYASGPAEVMSLRPYLERAFPSLEIATPTWALMMDPTVTVGARLM